MPKYIALLRAINVSGKNIIKMEALRTAVKELPFTNVSTYIQSGNVLFEADADARDCEQMLTELISKHFNLEITVIVLTPEDLADALADNPFLQKTSENDTQPYIGFLTKIPDAEGLERLSTMDFKGDQWIVSGKRIYFWYADSAANTKLSNAVVEKKLDVRATTRNSKTVRKLLELSS